MLVFQIPLGSTTKGQGGTACTANHCSKISKYKTLRIPSPTRKMFPRFSIRYPTGSQVHRENTSLSSGRESGHRSIRSESVLPPLSSHSGVAPKRHVVDLALLQPSRHEHCLGPCRALDISSRVSTHQIPAATAYLYSRTSITSVSASSDHPGLDPTDGTSCRWPSLAQLHPSAFPPSHHDAVRSEALFLAHQHAVCSSFEAAPLAGYTLRQLFTKLLPRILHNSSTPAAHPPPAGQDVFLPGPAPEYGNPRRDRCIALCWPPPLYNHP